MDGLIDKVILLTPLGDLMIEFVLNLISFNILYCCGH